MKSSNLVLIISLVLITGLFSSCKRKVKSYIVSGHLYKTCPKQALQNVQIDLMYQGATGIVVKEKIAETVFTDINGYFSFTTSEFDTWLRIPSFGNYDCELGTNIQKTDITDIEIYKENSNALQIYLNVSTPYTVNDTLAFYLTTDSAGNSININGPFQSGLLYTTANFSNNSIYYNNKNNDTLHPNHIITVLKSSTMLAKTWPIDFVACGTSSTLVSIE